MGNFIISTRRNNEYQFNLRADNNENILSSESYGAKSDCRDCIESVRRNAADDAQYERLNAINGQFYFNLKGSNGEIIGTSEMYDSASGRDGGIDSVKQNAPAAAVVDQSA